MRKNHWAKSFSVIGGADGPTSIFLAGKGKAPRTWKQKLLVAIFQMYLKRNTKKIKANPHTIEQVVHYTKKKWGYKKLDRHSKEYQTEYRELRAALLLKLQPELVGNLKEIPQLKSQDEAGIKQLMEEVERRQKAAENIPKEQFDIELCMLKKKNKNFESSLVFERTYGYIGGSSSGTKLEMKKFDRIFRDIYRYYGVSREDIEQKTERYEELLSVLSRR